MSLTSTREKCGGRGGGGGDSILSHGTTRGWKVPPGLLSEELLVLCSFRIMFLEIWNVFCPFDNDIFKIRLNKYTKSYLILSFFLLIRADIKRQKKKDIRNYYFLSVSFLLIRTEQGGRISDRSLIVQFSDSSLIGQFPPSTTWRSPQSRLPSAFRISVVI